MLSDLFSRTLVTASFLFLSAAIPAGASFKSTIGFDRLEDTLGKALPDGSNVSILLVEALEDGGWAPRESNDLSGKEISYAAAPTYSAHAYEVAAYLIGSSRSILGKARKLQSTNRSLYAYKSLWAGRTLFPAEAKWDVENHSWGGDFGSDNLQILQRMDYRAERDQVVIVAGINNGSGSRLSPVVANLYNGITVGVVSGAHARGGSTLDGSGRQKPDLVAPAPVTSHATPMVASSAAFLLSEVKRTSSLSAARHPAVIKALLLAGARREGIGWSNSTSRPLDKILGAGVLQVENSYRILKAGRHTSGRQGWDLARTASGGKRYTFEVPSGQTLSFSAALAWHRIVKASGSDWNRSPGAKYSGTSQAMLASELANLDLVLWRLGATRAADTKVTESVGDADNVELIDRRLVAGRYALEVRGDEAGAEYGLAWGGELSGKRADDEDDDDDDEDDDTPAPTPKPSPAPPTTGPGDGPLAGGGGGGDVDGGLKGKNVGQVGIAGAVEKLSAKSFKLTGSGSGATGWDDAFFFAHGAADRETVLTVRIDSFDGSKFSSAGLMLRNSHDARSPHVALFVNEEGRVKLAARTTSSGRIVAEGPKKTFPLWLRLKRDGQRVTASYSTNGSSFTKLDDVTSTLAAGTLGGIFCASGDKGSRASVRLSSFENE